MRPLDEVMKPRPSARPGLPGSLAVLAMLLCCAAQQAQANTKLPMQTHAAQLQGDAQRGKTLYEAKCSACHSAAENRVGPLHAGVLGRKAGGVKDYDYSDALRQSRVVWSRVTLQQWLTDPEKLIPGQKMGYRLEQAQDRADVAWFLATLK
jgi:cytochrome c